MDRNQKRQVNSRYYDLCLALFLGGNKWEKAMKNLVLFGIFSLAALSVNAQELLMSEPQDGWVHYSTSQYGGKISEKYTQGSVLEAVQSGKPLPYGSAVVGIEYEDEGGRKGRLIRFIQMQKVPDFGKSVPQSYRNGDWQYSSFTPQKRLITDDPVQRCMSCHKRASDTEFIFGFDSMKAFSENR